jgi:hypothetical protein
MLKTISSITNALGALNYKGTWNASSNTPTLADGTGAKGDYYVVSTAGTQTFGGVQLFFGLGDWIAYNGAVWQRVEGGSDGNFANVTLTSTDAGATASPLLELYRDSATPAASDTLGEIEFNGEDSAGNKQAYGLIHASILSPTSTAEQGQLHFETATAGALTEKMIIGTNNLVINEIGAVFNVRIEGDTDANLFYTDATNSRIGVGTISPAVKLDVAGDVQTSSNVNFATTSTGLTSTGTITCKSSSAGIDWAVYSAASSTNPAYFIQGNGTVNGIGTGASGSASAMYVNRDTGSLRSINAAGSLNASGADYAEYMVKDGDFVIAKGDICGIKANGKLTNVFADAISFVVKSTDPSYVGGDTWFNEQPPVDESLLDSWKQRLEAARAPVDRIAFCGIVPVNVQGATSGQFIIPVDDNGAIKGQAISNPTFEQYQAAVGKVIAVKADGRAKIIVKIS